MYHKKKFEYDKQPDAELLKLSADTDICELFANEPTINPMNIYSKAPLPTREQPNKKRKLSKDSQAVDKFTMYNPSSYFKLSNQQNNSIIPLSINNPMPAPHFDNLTQHNSDVLSSEVLSILINEVNHRMQPSYRPLPRPAILKKIMDFKLDSSLANDVNHANRIDLFFDIICTSFSSSERAYPFFKMPNDLSRDKYFSQLISPLIESMKQLPLESLAWIFMQSASKSCKRYECIKELGETFIQKASCGYSSTQLQNLDKFFVNLQYSIESDKFKRAFQQLREQCIALDYYKTSVGYR